MRAVSGSWHLRSKTLRHYYAIAPENIVTILEEHAELNQSIIDQHCDKLVQNEYDARSKRRDWSNYTPDDMASDVLKVQARICASCKTALTKMTRKHHCRQCRRLVCHRSACVQKRQLHGSRGFKSKVYVCTSCVRDMEVAKRKAPKWRSDWRQSVLMSAKTAMLARGVGEWGCNTFGRYIRVLASESPTEIFALVGRMFTKQAARDLTRCNVHVCGNKLSSGVGMSLGAILCQIWADLNLAAIQLPINLATMEYLRVVVLLLGQGCLSFLLVLVTQLYKQRDDYVFKNGSDLPAALVPFSYVGSTVQIDVRRRTRDEMPTLIVSHVRPFDIRQWLTGVDEPVRCGVLLMKVEMMYRAHPRAVGLGEHSLQVFIQEDNLDP